MKKFNKSGSSYNKSGGSFNKGGGSFNKSGSSYNKGASSDFKYKKSAGARDEARPEMHKATCAECGRSCEVPFKPSGSKPVFCSYCFKGKDDTGFKRDGGKSFNKSFNRSDNSRSFSNSSPNNPTSASNNLTKDQFETLNAKLDQILRALE